MSLEITKFDGHAARVKKFIETFRMLIRSSFTHAHHLHPLL